MCGSRTRFRWSASAASIPARRRWPRSGPGASLIQLYSALVFRGLRLVAEIKARIADGAARAGSTATSSELVGADAAAMTAEAWPP